MIRTFSRKDEYSPVIKSGNKSYKICWDREDLKNPIYRELTAEEKEREEHGETVEREIVGYEDSDYCVYLQQTLKGVPNLQDIKLFILSWYNKDIDSKILSGFVWNDMSIWLSSENQFNYKAAYDLAIQTNGASLPVTFKFGTTENPIYHTFNTIEELSDFYTKAIAYVNQTLADGWSKKDNIDWSVYENALKPEVAE